jgi:hypothetical protein
VLAALTLGTVTDGLMRVGLAAARLLLLSYNMPVKRRQVNAADSSEDWFLFSIW